MKVLSRPQRGTVYRRIRGGSRASYGVSAIYLGWLRGGDYNVDHVNVTEVVKKGRKRQWNYYMTGNGLFCYRQIPYIPTTFHPSLEVQLPGVKMWIPCSGDWWWESVLPLFYAWRKANVHHISVTVEDAGELKWRFRYSR